MQLKEQIELLTGADRVRICKDNTVIYSGYVGNIEHYKIEDFNETETIKEIRITPEIRHKKWKELGLMQPFKPEETPDYYFKDLQLALYYDIHI